MVRSRNFGKIRPLAIMKTDEDWFGFHIKHHTSSGITQKGFYPYVAKCNIEKARKRVARSSKKSPATQSESQKKSDSQGFMSRAGGDQTHDRGIMRWLLSVGLVRWRRIHPDIKEILSGGVGLVCGMRRGIFSIGVLACGFLSEGRQQSNGATWFLA